MPARKRLEEPSIRVAVLAPRYTYIEPTLAFNPMLSFLVVIMALFGGLGWLAAPDVNTRET